MVHLSQFPDNLLVKIFSDIEWLDQRVRLEAVCQRWQHLMPYSDFDFLDVQQLYVPARYIDQPQYIRRVYYVCPSFLGSVFKCLFSPRRRHKMVFRGVGTRPQNIRTHLKNNFQWCLPAMALRLLAEHMSDRLEALEFRDSQADIDPKGLCYLFRFPHLRRLVFNNFCNPSSPTYNYDEAAEPYQPQEFLRLLDSLTNLEVLGTRVLLGQNSPLDDAIPRVCNLNLKDLSVYQLEDTGLFEHIGERFPNLETLTIHSIEDYSWSAGLEQLSKLKSLTVTGGLYEAWPSQQRTLLEGCAALEQLNIAVFPYFDCAICGLSNLQSLTVSLSADYEERERNLTVLKRLGEAGRLKKLQLRVDFPIARFDILELIEKHFTSLTSLEITSDGAVDATFRRFRIPLLLVANPALNSLCFSVKLDKTGPKFRPESRQLIAATAQNFSSAWFERKFGQHSVLITFVDRRSSKGSDFTIHAAEVGRRNVAFLSGYLKKHCTRVRFA